MIEFKYIISKECNYNLWIENEIPDDVNTKTERDPNIKSVETVTQCLKVKSISKMKKIIDIQSILIYYQM
jgi:hypothetical protein